MCNFLVMSNSVSYSLDYHLFPPNTVFLRFRFTALTNQIPTFFSIFSVYSSSHPNITSIKVNNILCNHSVLMQTPVCSVRGLVAEMRKFTQTTKSCGRKGTARPLSQGESTLTLALAGFYCFSGHITLRMVLIYYAQLHFRWLPFTENKGEDVANYIKKEWYFQM